MDTFAPSGSTRNAEHTLRMLGENITFTGWQWDELLDELREDSDLARRIRERLALDEADAAR